MSTTEHYVLKGQSVCLICGDVAAWLEKRGGQPVHYGRNESLAFNLFTPGEKGQQPDFRDSIWEVSQGSADAYARLRFGADAYALPMWSTFLTAVTVNS